MSDTVTGTAPLANPPAEGSISPARAGSGTSSTDRPIPLWPEGVLALAAGITLVVIGLRHRVWIQRKVAETQRMVEEFQRQGGLDDLTHIARQASELVKGATG